MKKVIIPTLALALLASAATYSKASTIIINDPLSLTTALPPPTPVNLNGTKPTDRVGGKDVPNTAWSNAGDEFQVSETGTQASNNVPVAELNVGTLVANSTYTLTVHLDLTVDATNDDAAFGFDDNNIDYINSPTGPYLTYNGAGNATLFYGNNGGSSQSSLLTPGGDNILQLVLTTGTDYTVTALINGVTVGGSTYTYTTGNPAIDGIFIGAQGDDGAAFTNLQLSLVAPVPEPSTWALIVLGLGVLGVQLRRRATV